MPPYSESHDYMTAFASDVKNPGADNLFGALAYAGSGTGKYGKAFQDTWAKGFAPRLGIAYQLDKKTMVRASSGIYFASTGNVVPFLDTAALGYSATPYFESADGGFTPKMYWNQESFPQNFKRPPSIDPTFLNGQAINYIPRNGDRLPQTINWVLDVEREVAHNLSLGVMYIGSQSTHLGLSGSATELNYLDKSHLNLGFGLLAPCVMDCMPYSGFGTQLGNLATVAQALKPYPQYTHIGTDSVLLPEGKAHFHSLQTKVTKRMGYGLSGLAFFTWEKNMTNASGAGSSTYASSYGSTVQYPGDHSLAIDPATPPVIFGTSLSYQLPVGKGRSFMNHAPAIADGLLGGWTVSGSFRYTSGAALQINGVNPFAGNLGYSTLAPFAYANYLGGKPHGKWSGKFNPATDKYLNKDAFAAPALFTLGNTSQYLSWVRGFTHGSEALELSKTIPIHERVTFDLSADFVNPFNITRWGDPSTLAGVPTFGTVTSTQTSARQIQINGAVHF